MAKSKHLTFTTLPHTTNTCNFYKSVSRIPAWMERALTHKHTQFALRCTTRCVALPHFTLHPRKYLLIKPKNHKFSTYIKAFNRITTLDNGKTQLCWNICYFGVETPVHHQMTNSKKLYEISLLLYFIDSEFYAKHFQNDIPSIYILGISVVHFVCTHTFHSGN